MTLGPAGPTSSRSVVGIFKRPVVTQVPLKQGLILTISHKVACRSFIPPRAKIGGIIHGATVAWTFVPEETDIL